MLKKPLISLTAAALVSAPFAAVPQSAVMAQQSDPPMSSPVPETSQPEMPDPGSLKPEAAASGAGYETPFLQQLPASSMTARQLIDSKVLDVEGQEIGEVSDVILAENGKIVGIVLETGGFLGIGAKRLGLRSATLPRPAGDGVLRSGLTQEQIAQAPALQGGEEGVGEKLMKSIDSESAGSQAQ